MRTVRGSARSIDPEGPSSTVSIRITSGLGMPEANLACRLEIGAQSVGEAERVGERISDRGPLPANPFRDVAVFDVFSRSPCHSIDACSRSSNSSFNSS